MVDRSSSLLRPCSWAAGFHRWCAAGTALLAGFGWQVQAATVVTTNAVAVPSTLHDIKGPIVIHSPWMWVRLVVIVAALAALVALAWWWWNRGKKPETPGPTESPGDRARRRLTAVLDLIHDPERFATRISEIARIYLEERFGLHAPDRTTEEFLSELTTSVSLDARHKELLEGFLTRCDLVKFARAEPGQAELESLHASAERLVEETAPMPMVPPPLPGTQGGRA